MKKLSKIILIFLLVLHGISCDTAKKEKKVDSSKATKAKTLYTIDTASTSLLWTAYKFTDKLGVSGTFDEFKLRLKTDTGSLAKLLNNAAISINTNSVNSANEIRDPKLRTSFFKVFKTDTIFGEVIDTNNGIGVLRLKMNDLSNDTAFEYAIKNDTLKLSANLDLLSWNGEEALKTLNKECYQLHTGSDGISKLWPEVDVVLKIPVKKTSISN